MFAKAFLLFRDLRFDLRFAHHWCVCVCACACVWLMACRRPMTLITHYNAADRRLTTHTHTHTHTHALLPPRRCRRNPVT